MVEWLPWSSFESSSEVNCSASFKIFFILFLWIIFRFLFSSFSDKIHSRFIPRFKHLSNLKIIFNIELPVLLLSGRTNEIKPIYNCNSKTLLHSPRTTLIVPKMSQVMRFYRPTEFSKEFSIECIVWHFLWLVMNYITRLWTQDDLRACRIGVVIQRPFEFKNELSTTWVFFIFRRSQLWISTLTPESSANQSKCIQV